jgi:acylphosphatase
MQQHFNITVFGRVQGVGFRFHTKQIAQQLGLKGFVKNNYDGSVYIEVEGNIEKINEFISSCKKGPGFSSVENVILDEGKIKKFTLFEVKY